MYKFSFKFSLRSEYFIKPVQEKRRDTCCCGILLTFESLDFIYYLELGPKCRLKELS